MNPPRLIAGAAIAVAVAAIVAMACAVGPHAAASAPVSASGDMDIGESRGDVAAGVRQDDRCEPRVDVHAAADGFAILDRPDTSIERRHALAMGLLEYPSVALRDRFIDDLHRDPSPRWRAYCLQYLVDLREALGDDLSFTTIVDACGSADAEVAETAVFSVGRLARSANVAVSCAARAVLERSLDAWCARDRATLVRVAAIRCHGIAWHADSRARLLAIAADADEALPVRVAAIEVLAAVGSRGDAPAVAALADSTVPALADAARVTTRALAATSGVTPPRR